MGYYFLYTSIRIISFLPFRILFFISDILYILVYHIFNYRREVVRTNLRNAFPEKTLPEIITIEKKFYRHFCDLMVETVKMVDFSHERFLRHLSVENYELLHRFVEEKRNFILVSGHMGNWEWVSPVPQLEPDMKFYPIYHPLTSRAFDKFMVMLRSRFNGIPLPMKDTMRTVIGSIKNNELFAVWFICDQTPPKEGAYWTTFMNQETPVFLGPEKIAKKFNLPVVFLNVLKIKRGHYKIQLNLLEENPAKLPEFALTELHVRYLEEIIKEYPEQWLWSHRRWKHKRYEGSSLRGSSLRGSSLRSE